MQTYFGVSKQLLRVFTWACLGMAGTANGSTAAENPAANLSLSEQQLIAAVKENSGQAIALLEQSVKINSGTMNHAGVRAVGQLFQAQLQQLGFSTRWAEMPAAMQRAGHLIAEHEGAGQQGKRVLLIGHLDTVFEADSKVALWERHGDRIRGQGVSDMKGGDVVILEALRALKKIGALDSASIRVVFSGDEERAGSPLEIARADLIAAAKQSDIALAFENAIHGKDGKDTATIGRRASGSFSLKVQGQQGHSAGVFGAHGYGAIYETARILNSFREQLIEPDLTFNAGLMLGGSELSHDDTSSTGTAFGKNNVIPKSALVKGDLRYLSNAQRERTYAKMRAIVAQNLPGTSAEISFRETYPAMAPSAGNLAIFQRYSQASQDAGLGSLEIIAPGLRGAGDIQFVAPYLDSLDGLGASGRGAHSPDEDMELASLERASIRAALMIYRLTR
ncbi:M20/M25/M40 family metallo-hydrolase [Undibacterium parvum]|nr:M20/M25/M40 family metallo-hydrolase [Undibacterium parvum]